MERQTRAQAETKAAVSEAERDAARTDATAESERVKSLQASFEAAQAENKQLRVDVDARLTRAAEASAKAVAAERAISQKAGEAAQAAAVENAAKTAKLEAAEAMIKRLQEELQKAQES
jgi:hypothetical protein